MSEIHDNIAIVLGGNFNAASVGPAAVAEVTEAIKSDPDAYLAALREMVLGDAFDPKLHADLYLTPLLRVIGEARPGAVRRLVATLLRLYDGVLIPFDAAKDPGALDAALGEETVNLLFRLNTKRLELRELAATLDERVTGGGQ